LAVENGYKIKTLKGYISGREKDVFKDYINEIFNIKYNPINKTQRSLAKSLFNNL
jgi:hypothetical protein